jgi:hypothetical protein
MSNKNKIFQKLFANREKANESNSNDSKLRKDKLFIKKSSETSLPAVSPVENPTKSSSNQKKVIKPEFSRILNVAQIPDKRKVLCKLLAKVFILLKYKIDILIF